MAYLLDTNVVPELRKRAPDPNVVAWYEGQSQAAAYLSTLVIAEMRQGIERVRRRAPGQADALERWLSGLVSSYHSRILPVTVEVAQEWGRPNASPQPPPIVDGLMAATANVHRLTLVTRNITDVARTGVAIINPFAKCQPRTSA